MIHHFFDGRPWFRAKSLGIGAGLPIAWQGWAVMATHMGAITGLAVLLVDRSPALAVVAILLASLAPIPLYRAKTEGGWRWRWRGPGRRPGRS